MEALEPGKPLSFLDHRIVCGNSLLGTTPKQLAQGIPDEAYIALEGDDKKWVASLKKRNKEERGGQGTFDFGPSLEVVAEDLHTELVAISALPDVSVADLREKARRYQAMVSSAEAERAKLVADAWCSAFVAKKEKDAPPVVTTDILRKLQRAQAPVDAQIKAEIRRLTDEYKFFHWYLAFPDVFAAGHLEAAENSEMGWTGGFSLVLGNPPWDTLSPDAKEFFSTYQPSIRTEDQAGQDRIVATLLEDTSIAQRWERTRRELYAQVHFFQESGRYRLFAPGNLGKGDFNAYRMFVELALDLGIKGGFASQIVPENLYNGANAAAIRQHLLERCDWTHLFGFQNLERKWFPGIYYRMRFCAYVARIGGKTSMLRTTFGIVTEAQLEAAKRDGGMSVSPELIKEFSPDALAISEFDSQLEIDLATKMYAAWPKFGDVTVGSPCRHYMAELHMGNDRDFFTEDRTGFAVYEGRMVDAFDHRAKAYRSGRGRAADWVELSFGDSEKVIQAQWYLLPSSLPKKLEGRPQRYRIGFCDVASPTNERTLVGALIPPETICGDKVPTITFELGFEWAYMVWLSVANSFVMDFLARKKVSLKMSYTVLDSLPFPRLPRNHPQARRVVELAARLTCTGPEMRAYWDMLARDGWLPALRPTDPLPGLVNETERREARAELDAIVARDLFGLTRKEFDHILDTFPIIHRRDEARPAEHRTKRLVLEYYDGIRGTVVNVQQSGRGKLLPFRRVALPRSEDQWRTCIPLYSLKAAAGEPDNFQFVEEHAWVEPVTDRALQRDMFVAWVEGDSMEPTIPAGSWCLFGPSPVDSDGETVLIELRERGDMPEGGRYLLKRFSRLRDDTVQLSSFNSNYPPLRIERDAEIRIIARWLGVLVGDSIPPA